MVKQTDRVQKNTPKSMNQEIEAVLQKHIWNYSRKSNTAISKRIKKLEKEWNMDRVLITNAATIAGVGLILGLTRNRNWFFLPGVVLTFLLQHGLQGWCPPLPLFRKLGVRSFKEIDRERYALKYLRGDFEKVSSEEGKPAPEKLFDAVSL